MREFPECNEVEALNPGPYICKYNGQKEIKLFGKMGKEQTYLSRKLINYHFCTTMGTLEWTIRVSF